MALGLDLPGAASDALRDLLDQEAHCSEKIKNSDLAVKGFYEADEDCKRISTIPGFGVFLSVLAKVEIGRIDRFKSASRLCSYAGVVPSTYSSSRKTQHRKIMKMRNRHLRYYLEGTKTRSSTKMFHCMSCQSAD